MTRDEAMMRLVCAVESGNAPVFDMDEHGRNTKLTEGAVYDRALGLLECLEQGGCVFETNEPTEE